MTERQRHPNQVVQGRLGLSYLFNRNDTYIGRSLAEYGEYSGIEAEFLEALVRPGDVVVEVGANIGSLSVGLARKLGPSGRLIAFEPQRLPFQMLCANAALNGLANIDCYWMAVGRSRGLIMVPEINPGVEENFGALSLKGVSRGRPVPCDTLDNLLGHAEFHLLKIDVQGMEADVLAGGSAAIMRSRPLIYAENEEKDAAADLIGQLERLGYECFWHFPPYFRPDNYRKNRRNVFGKVASKNMLCLPRDRELTPPPLMKATRDSLAKVFP